jgi:hypothetical protein
LIFKNLQFTWIGEGGEERGERKEERGERREERELTNH